MLRDLKFFGEDRMLSRDLFTIPVRLFIALRWSFRLFRDECDLGDEMA